MSQATVPEQSERKRTVFVIDDAEFFRETLVESLRESDFEVHPFGAVQEAYVAFDRISPIDLIVMKLELPDMPGDEACLAIRSDPKLANIPILLIGSTEASTLAEAAERAGANGFLKKPFRPMRVMQWLEQRRQGFEGVLSHPVGNPLDPITAPPGSASRGKLLIVDDEELPIQILVDLLEPCGYQISTARDWKSFRDALFDEEYSAILLDIKMPDITGDKLGLFVRDFVEPPKPGVIIHSGLEEKTLRRIARDIGAKNYLMKGCNPDHVIRVVDAAVKAFELEQEFA